MTTFAESVVTVMVPALESMLDAMEAQLAACEAAKRQGADAGAGPTTGERPDAYFSPLFFDVYAEFGIPVPREGR